MVSWLILAALSAPPCARVSLHARVHANLRDVSGTITCSGAAEDLELLAYPNVLVEPRALNDLNALWFYPEGFDAASMQIDGATPTDPERVRWRPLPGQRVFRFRTRVPLRRGTFGLHQGIAYLLGGWHPAFAHAGGPALPLPVEYHVELPGRLRAMVAGRPASSREASGTTTARYVSVVLAPLWRVHTQGQSVLLWPLPSRPPPSASHHAPTHLWPITTVREEGQGHEILATLAQGDARLPAYGLAPRPLVLVVAPLRENAVEHFDGGFAVSDRAFAVWRLDFGKDWMTRYHRPRLWRAQAAHYALPHARALEAPHLASVMAEAVGAALGDTLAQDVYQEEKDAADVLDQVALIPEIDALVYAPRIPLPDAYYRAVDETPPMRRQLDDFDRHTPKGRVLHEKLRDRVGRTKATALAATYPTSTLPWLSLVTLTHGTDTARALQRWLAPYPQVDYVLGPVTSDLDTIRVQVRAAGPDADAVREPIAVRVEDASGQEHRVSRVGPGEVVVRAPGPPEAVVIDPAGRLVELHHEPGDDGKGNNRHPARWRFLLNNITSLFAVTGGQLSLAADFSLRRIHDLVYRLDFAAAYGPAGVSAAVTGSYGFGQEITPLRLGHRVALGLGYTYLTPERGAPVPGHEANVGVSYGFDNRLMAPWAFEGHGHRVYLSGGVGQDNRGQRYLYAQGGAAVLGIWPIHLDHALVGRLRADATVGQAPPQALFRLGGRYTGGRGFEPHEARGPYRVIASTEYRHVLAGDTHADLWGVLYVERVEGALFADGIYLPGARGCAGDLFADAGYGVRFIADVLNLSPSSLAIDVGVPITRCQTGRRVPFAVYMAFQQSFSSF